MKKIKIIIADDHGIVRKGLRSLLEMEDDLAVVGEAADGQAAVAETLRLKPDVVVMDLMMPKMDGTEAIAEIRKASSPAKILLLTTFATSEGIAKSLDAGANGAILKSSADDMIVEAIRAVHKGSSYVSPEVQGLLMTAPPVPEFTQKQLDILAAMARGLSDDDISKALGIAKNTVRAHLKSIFPKLGAANRTEAASVAISKQLVKM